MINEPAGQVLTGGHASEVVRVGDAVHRSTGHWTPAVHALLRYLAAMGFDAAPRVLGMSDEGREVLTFVAGDAATIPLARSYQGDDVLMSLARLMRRLHDVSAGMPEASELPWRWLVGASRGGDVICHNDLFPPNVVFRGVEPVCLIDWDFAAPGTRLHDLASLAEHWVPLVSDARADRLGWASPDRGRRLRLMLDSYGVGAADRERFLDACVERRATAIKSQRTWAELGEPAFVRLVKRGNLEIMQNALDWLLGAIPALTEWLR